MRTECFEFVWRQVHERHSTAAVKFDRDLFPDLSRRAIAEAAEFAARPVPDSGHQLNLRRVDAYTMKLNWATELQRSTSAQLEGDQESGSNPVAVT
jgi:hypothetical protein